MRGAVHILLFGVAYIATATVAGSLLPPAQVSVLLPKLQHLEDHKDDYSAVFIGSSLVFRQIVPATFEAEMAKRGHDERIFNLGVPGMRLPESLYVLERFLELEPANLRWVFVELKNLTTSIDERNVLSDREVQWHDGASTLRVFRGVLDGDGRWLAKVRELYGHGRHFLYRLAAVGRGRSAVPTLSLNPAGTTRQSLKIARFMREHAGWVPLELEEGSVYERRRQEFLDDPRRFEDALDALSHEDPVDPGYQPFQRACVDRIVELMDGRDARLVFVVLLGMRATPHLLQAQREGLIPDLVVMNDPGRFPYLYEPERRYDHDHLTQPASRIFTREFVKELDRFMGSSR